MSSVSRETTGGVASVAAPVRQTQPVREVCRVVWQREEKAEAANYFRLRLRAPSIAPRAQAGQFLHLLPREPEQNGGFDPLLRRAFSVMHTEGDELELLYRAGGRGTNRMTRWREGDFADVLGPLGRGFGAFAPRNLLVGGGVGVPPMVMLAARSVAAGGAATAMALIGARSRVDVLCEADFARLRVPFQVATEDGSAGARGRVTDLLLLQLSQAREESKVFACGPLPMLRAVAEVCARFQVPCEVSLEEAMPCGVGVCNSCVVPVVPSVGGDEYGSYRRICVEGPVVPSDEVDWARL